MLRAVCHAIKILMKVICGQLPTEYDVTAPTTHSALGTVSNCHQRTRGHGLHPTGQDQSLH